MPQFIRSSEQDYQTNCLLINSVHCTNAIGMGEKCSLLHNRYYLCSAWMDSSQICTSDKRHPTPHISFKRNCLRYLLLMKYEIYQLDHFFWVTLYCMWFHILQYFQWKNCLKVVVPIFTNFSKMWRFWYHMREHIRSTYWHLNIKLAVIVEIFTIKWHKFGIHKTVCVQCTVQWENLKWTFASNNNMRTNE